MAVKSDWERWTTAWTTSIEDGWRRAIAADGDYLRRAASDGLRLASATVNPIEGGFALLRDYCDYGMALAMTPGLAAWRGIAAWQGQDPRLWGTPIHAVEGKPVMLPARVGAAAQGFALYAVPKAGVEPLLPPAMASVEYGKRQTLLMLFAVDYHASDLGAYQEFGVAFWVRPRHAPAAMPGAFMHTLIVNREFTHAAGRAIWGYAKTLGTLAFRYDEREARCTLSRDDKTSLGIAFRRGGAASSTAIPFYTYTLLQGEVRQTVFLRNGKGERSQAGAEGVTLTLHDKTDPTSRMLAGLGLPQAPLWQGWSEEMSGILGPPLAVMCDGSVPRQRRP